MKKKLTVIIMAVTMSVSLCACGSANISNKETSTVQNEQKDTADSNLESSSKSDLEPTTEDEPITEDESTTEDEPTTENNSDDNDYELLEEFIELINTYSDPPYLEEDEYDEYFKEQYDEWRNQEAYQYVIKDSNGHFTVVDHSEEYVGTWMDKNSGRCYMEIVSFDGVNFSIDINQADGANNNMHWILSGQYDEVVEGIRYCGSKVNEFYTDDGERIDTEIYVDGDGLIAMGNEDILYWYDYNEQRGEDCAFEKVEQDTAVG